MVDSTKFDVKVITLLGTKREDVLIAEYVICGQVNMITEKYTTVWPPSLVERK